jgi:hypothetical protein
VEDAAVSRDFIPRAHCTVASGACFDTGQCLGDCAARKRQDTEQRLKALEARVLEMERTLLQLRNSTQDKTDST